MPRSKRFRELEREIRALRLHFLPRKFSLTGSYPPRVVSRTAAFRVLAHAEIEAFLEDRSVEVARNALRLWKERGHVGRTALCLIGFAGRMMEEPPVSLAPDQPKQLESWEIKLRIDKKLDEASRVFHSAVRSNHGVKELNVLRLLLPLGVGPDDLDPLWLSTINTFGELRGESAHTSRSAWKTSQPPDPESEYNTVKKVLAGLMKVDSLLNDLLV